MKLVIDDNGINFEGSSMDLYIHIAILLMELENLDGLPVDKALRRIAKDIEYLKKDWI